MWKVLKKDLHHNRTVGYYVNLNKTLYINIDIFRYVDIQNIEQI